MTVLTKIEKFKDGELQILKQSNSSFQGKVYLGKDNGIPKYKYKSVKTNDIKDALKQLNDWFYEIKFLSTSGQFQKLYLVKNRAKKIIQNYLNNHFFKTDKSRKNDISLSKNIIEFLDINKIDDFNKKNLIELKIFLTGKNFTNNTIRHHFNVIRKIYNDLLCEDQITKKDVPVFPNLPKNSSEITYLNFDEYRQLMSISEERMNKKGLSRATELSRKSLHYYVQFVCGSGLRRSEADNLNFEDIKIDYDKNDKSFSLEINIKKGKTGPRTVISKSSSYYAFLNLKKIYSEYSELVQQFPKSKIFPKDFRKSASELFKAAKVHVDMNGFKRNLTTLRKTYICWGLINGEKIFDLALNCGNSPEIIKTNYADKLTTVALKHRLRRINKIEY